MTLWSTHCMQYLNGFAESTAKQREVLDEIKTILAETFKLLGNSIYGNSLENLASVHNVVYSTSKSAERPLRTASE
ncbi:hypothetical protein RRG08_059418 [Elysia crispata]|uniref:Uncharacterized protein n=1 Tax=Elysia crispata TaxID=231223 RepID=A0AAE0Z0G6_9GAST|nr:hypothetical protein RRG08_059418 [Elysia crispata]